MNIPTHRHTALYIPETNPQTGSMSELFDEQPLEKLFYDDEDKKLT